jgi:hypothetical protein
LPDLLELVGEGGEDAVRGEFAQVQGGVLVAAGAVQVRGDDHRWSARPVIDICQWMFVADGNRDGNASHRRPPATHFNEEPLLSVTAAESCGPAT